MQPPDSGGDMRRMLVLVAVLALAGTACGSDQDPTLGDGDIGTPPPEATEDAIVAEDQTSDGTSVTVSEVTIVDSPGFIAVHRDDGGAPGEVVGHVGIPQGTSLQVIVPLDETVSSGEYWPMLHLDAGEVGTYEFPGADGPVMDDGGDIVMVQITLTVEE